MVSRFEAKNTTLLFIMITLTRLLVIFSKFKLNVRKNVFNYTCMFCLQRKTSLFKENL